MGGARPNPEPSSARAQDFILFGSRPGESHSMIWIVAPGGHLLAQLRPPSASPMTISHAAYRVLGRDLEHRSEADPAWSACQQPMGGGTGLPTR